MSGLAFPNPAQVASRIVASLFGSWIFVWGVTSLGVALGMSAGMPYDEARTLLYLLAFIVFLIAFCWAFAARSVLRVWLILAGGGALMTAVAWLMLPSLH